MLVFCYFRWRVFFFFLSLFIIIIIITTTVFNKPYQSTWKEIEPPDQCVFNNCTQNISIIVLVYYKPSLQSELQVTNSLWCEGKLRNFQNFTRTLLVFKSDQRLKWRRVVVLLSEVKKKSLWFCSGNGNYINWFQDWLETTANLSLSMSDSQERNLGKIIRSSVFVSWQRRSDNLHKPIRSVQRRAKLILVLNDNELSLNHEKSKIHTWPPFCLCSLRCCFKQRVARVLGLVHNDFLREAITDAFVLKKHVWN